MKKETFCELTQLGMNLIPTDFLLVEMEDETWTRHTQRQPSPNQTGDFHGFVLEDEEEEAGEAIGCGCDEEIGGYGYESSDEEDDPES